MKIQRFHADEEGYIRIKQLIRPLYFGLYQHEPCFWGVVNPLGKDGIDCNVIAVEDDKSVDEGLIANYRATIIDQESGRVWHLFEEPSQIVQGPSLLPGNDSKAK